MRRALTATLVAILALTLGGPLVAPVALAQSTSVNAWVEVGTTEPGVGCVVDVTAEIRSAAAGVEGADVAVALSIDGTSDVVSSDRQVTDGSGIAWLSFDTSGAYDGAKTWLEVIVNGSYVGGRTIWVTADGGCSGAPAGLELGGDVPTGASGGAGGQAASGGGEVVIPGILTYRQERGLSCEYASLAIATGTLGGWVSEYDFESVIGPSDNPHWGYRGYIDGAWGNTDDYGIYAEPLVPALNQFGFNAEAFYGGRGDLIAQIDQGRPTLVWLGMWGDTSFDAYSADGTPYQLTAGMHVMVAYGYDDGGLYLSDPGSGSLVYYDWGTFEWMWGVMDGMALSVFW
jgi:uncharacterized protein YvpB